MAKRIRKKTKTELSSPEFLDRSKLQALVSGKAYNIGKRLSKTRQQFVLDIANSDWVHRFEELDDPKAWEREERKWRKLRNAFLKDTIKPLEIHWFACNWNCDQGVKPLLKIEKMNIVMLELL